MEYLLAGLPVLTVIVLLAFRVSPLIAAVAALAVVFLLAGIFPLDVNDAVVAMSSLWPVTVTVALLMFSGIVITNIQEASGAQESLNRWLNRIIDSPQRAALLYGITVVPLFESLIGWGIGVVAGIPLLLGTGIEKKKAIQVALLGLMLCPWGSFAPALLLVAELTGYELAALGTATAMFNIFVLIVLSVAIVLVVGGLSLLRRVWGEVLVTISCMGAVLVLANWFVAPVLGGVLSSLAGAFVLVAFSRSKGSGSRLMPKRAFLGLVPYTFVLVGLIATNALASVTPDGVLKDVMTNPGIWLTVAVMQAPIILRMSWVDTRRTFAASVPSWLPVCAVTVLLIVLGTLLGINGMSATLAEGAKHLGAAFVGFVPVIGFIAGFVTTSNTAAAAMLAEPLRVASTSLGLNPASVLGMQTAVTGAAVMCSPARMVLAIETANLVRPEFSGKVTAGSVLMPVLIANVVIVLMMAAIGYLWL